MNEDKTTKQLRFMIDSINLNTCSNKDEDFLNEVWRLVSVCEKREKELTKAKEMRK